MAYYSKWPSWAQFLTNFLSILPMAWLIGNTTEELGKATKSDLCAGLLNATFGNIVEMVLCIIGIMHNEITVVKCTLMGSILSNSLLVLGTSLVYGGYFWNGEGTPGYQKYNYLGAGASNSLMLFSAIGIILPTMYKVEMDDVESTLKISRSFSVLLLVAYCLYIFFQLKTHPHFFEDEDNEQEGSRISGIFGIVLLFVLTMLTSACSEFLISSIEGAIDTWNVSREFIGIIVLPIIGNAAEHYSAIVQAGKNNVNLTLSVAMGSACQMALFATPATVMFGWAFNRPVDLNFHRFQVVVYVMSCILVANVLKDGTANWLEGSVLLTAYIAIGMIYYFENEGFSKPIEDIPGGFDF